MLTSDLGISDLNGRYILHYTLLDIESHEKMSGGAEFFFIGLKDFEKSGKKFANDLEKWIYLLRNSSSLTEIPNTFVGDAKFSSYFEACERAGFTKDEELQYVKDMMTKNDIENSKREACEKAKAEGITEKSLEVAAKMKGKGLDAETIADCTGLTVEEVEAL